MPKGDYNLYDMISCDPASYPNLVDLATTGATPSNYTGMIVYITSPYSYIDPVTNITTVYPADSSRTYLVTNTGINLAFVSNFVPNVQWTNLDTCADAIKDKMFTVTNCSDYTDIRVVLLAANYAIGTVLKFVGETDCYTVVSLESYYDENPTVDASYADCRLCAANLASGICEYDERQLNYAVSLTFPKTEPIDRGFSECCYSNLVFGDLGDTDPYRNDYTSVFYKRQTPNDTVTYQLIGVTTGTTNLPGGTHGILYPYGGAEQPDLSYFKVIWRDVLSALGEDIYTIRMQLTIGGVAINVDSLVTYDLRQFSQTLADGTVRIEGKMDGKLEKINTDFKNTGYENSVRVQGYFGDKKANWEQDNVVFSSSKGQNYYDSQITMSNKYEYIFNAYNIPECVTRPLYNELLFSNELFISDYNINNHSYLYELQPVILKDDNGLAYKVQGRGVDVNITFEDRTKDNRKTNC